MDPPNTVIYNCSSGHTMVVRGINQAEVSCKLCVLLHQLRKTGEQIECIQPDFEFCQRSFEFTCKLGHVFSVTVSSKKRGCPACGLLKIAQRDNPNITMDANCHYMHDQSRIRFHCNRLRHDPQCTRPLCTQIRTKEIACKYSHDPLCDNFISCGQDFYATPKMIMYSKISCENNHRWMQRPFADVFTMVRVFETLFDAKFDDNCGIELTGYNSELKLAFTHGGDSKPNKYRAQASAWCAQNGVDFIHIDAAVTGGRAIACAVATALPEKYHKKSILGTVHFIRARIRDMDRANKLFADRCK